MMMWYNAGVQLLYLPLKASLFCWPTVTQFTKIKPRALGAMVIGEVLMGILEGVDVEMEGRIG